MNAALKRTFVFILAVCLSLTLLPAPALALTLTATVDANGSGWTWASASKTLTLNNATIGTDTDPGFSLPHDSMIILVDGSSNKIIGGVTSSGGLTITGGGNLEITDGEDGIHLNSYGPTNALTIQNCGEIRISTSGNFGLYSSGSIEISNCPYIEVISVKYAIATKYSGINIINSKLKAKGGELGLVTGDSGSAGGDIVITNSTVEAACSETAEYVALLAAIFAGDNADGQNGNPHSKIILNGCAIIEPPGGRILDVNSAAFECQSITGIPGIQVISDPINQTAKHVKIAPMTQTHYSQNESSYTVTYNANGGAGTPPIDPNTYYAGERVFTKSGDGLTRKGYTFAGWELLDGTRVNDPFSMPARNIILYAVWLKNITSPPKTGDLPVSAGAALVLAALCSALLIKRAVKINK